MRGIVGSEGDCFLGLGRRCLRGSRFPCPGLDAGEHFAGASRPAGGVLLQQGVDQRREGLGNLGSQLSDGRLEAVQTRLRVAIGVAAWNGRCRSLLLERTRGRRGLTWGSRARPLACRGHGAIGAENPAVPRVPGTVSPGGAPARAHRAWRGRSPERGHGRTARARRSRL